MAKAKKAKKIAKKGLRVKKEAKAKKEKTVGKVFSYYTNIGVAAIELSGNLAVGDKIHIKGATTDFEQCVDSMQIDGKGVEKAGKGKQVGIKLKDRARPNDVVYKA